MRSKASLHHHSKLKHVCTPSEIFQLGFANLIIDVIQLMSQVTYTNLTYVNRPIWLEMSKR